MANGDFVLAGNTYDSALSVNNIIKMSDINLSLDEIIKLKNNKPTGNQRFSDNRKPAPVLKRLNDGPKQLQRKPVVDARMKLLKNHAVVDARLRLEALRKRKNRGVPRSPGNVVRQALRGRLGNPLIGRAPAVMDVDEDVFDYGLPFPRNGGPLVRTVENDRAHYGRRPFDWDRPMEDDEFDLERLRRFDPLRETTAVRAGLRDLEGISMTVTNFNLRKPIKPILSNTVRELSPTTLPKFLARPGPAQSLSERFHRSCDRNAEAFLKVQALRSQLQATQVEQSRKSESGHRIVVSNLVHSVTHEDVKELFADIGELLSSHVVRPGVAEVVYRNYEDAVRAVDVYHNRQLDGQPMKCLLVKSSQSLPKKSNMELDVVTLRNALHKTAAATQRI